MNRETFIRRVQIEAPVEEVFRWHTRPGALERLTPPWVKMRVLQRKGGIEDGARVTLELEVGPFRVAWQVEHRGFMENRQFCDVQVRGPFAHWEHAHRFEPDGEWSCYVQDKVDYALRFGPLGNLLFGHFVHRELERLFIYRHRILTNDIALHMSFVPGTPWRILVSGSSGLIGSALIPFLTTGGHEVVRLVRPRSTPSGKTVAWDPEAGPLDPAELEDFDAVVHLAGESLAGGRWTDERKRRIRDSRVEGTRLLCEALARVKRPPRVLVAASAVGYYGDRGADIVAEDGAPGPGFLAQVCGDWEAATLPASRAGIRVVNLRLGAVLSSAGGLLARLLPLFNLGLGGPLGTGYQSMSWVSIDDAVGIVHHALFTDQLAGPVNAVSPFHVTNREFAEVLGRVLGRPARLAVPEKLLRTLFGQMADEVLLSGSRVEPRRLLDSGYIFDYPEFEFALRHVLGRV